MTVHCRSSGGSGDVAVMVGDGGGRGDDGTDGARSRASTRHHHSEQSRLHLRSTRVAGVALPNSRCHFGFHWSVTSRFSGIDGDGRVIQMTVLQILSWDCLEIL